MSEIAEVVASQEWVETVAKPLQEAIEAVFKPDGARAVKDALNGTWLGHPLHPVITDVPIGAWTMAQVFDTMDAVSGDGRYANAAQVCITTGLVGAAGAAITGLTDWSDTGGKSRRFGLVHGLINLTATGLFLASALMRRRGRSNPAVAASTAGYGLAMAGAYLGGSLVFQRRIGVNHGLEENAPEEFRRTIRDTELAEGEKRCLMVGDAPVLLVRHNGRVCALSERCAHQGGPLSEGELRDGVIHCPWHDSQYCVEDGALVHGPSTFNQPCYESRIVDGFIEVKPTAG